jgi:hypothetical protein
VGKYKLQMKDVTTWTFVIRRGQGVSDKHNGTRYEHTLDDGLHTTGVNNDLTFYGTHLLRFT